LIRLISIRNFRSIENQAIPTEEITTFVGNNDAGKSNILRAINLFFNGETDHKTPLNFNADFNLNAKVYKQRAKEITIELGLKLPKSYRRDNYPETIYWKKVWRESGEHKESEEMKYCTIANNKFINKHDFPSRSKIPSLAHNINYIYIPAIKDKNFFVELQGKIYDVLSQSVEGGLHSSALSFENMIRKEFTGLLKNIDSTFENNNSISLPQNLRNIFENLEFKSDKIPLSRRGDGIKIRHIPAMLRFIGEKISSKHKTLISPQIWGFEEPENNVEFSSCFNLNEQFIDAANNNTQIILTTHSPAIYNIHEKAKGYPNIKSIRYHVCKSDLTNFTELSLIDNSSLHNKIGFMPLVSPIISEYEEKWITDKNRQESIILSLTQELEKHKKHRIFIEGKSDRAILSRAIKYYQPDLINLIHFDVEGNNSAASAADKAKAFYLIQKHKKPEHKLKAVLILDNDEKGSECRNDIQNSIGSNYGGILKIKLLKKTRHLGSLIEKGFKLSADLESLLPEYMWSWALKNNCLIPKEDFSQKLTQATINRMFEKQQNPNDLINQQTKHDQTMINYGFDDNGKEKISKLIESLSDEQIIQNNILGNFDNLVSEINEFIKST
jgi:predicted ATPase